MANKDLTKALERLIALTKDPDDLHVRGAACVAQYQADRAAIQTDLTVLAGVVGNGQQKPDRPGLAKRAQEMLSALK